MFYEIAYVILLGWLSWEDIKQLHISIIGLAILGCISLSQAFLSHEPLLIPLLVALGTYIILRLLNYGMIHLSKTPALGQGDVWLMSILVINIYPDHIPIFLILVGILSWSWGMYWSRTHLQKNFPMAPPISVAFMVVRLF